MARFNKWIGGGLGWALLGPLGGLLGFALGSLLDSNTPEQGQTMRRGYGNTTQGDFLSSLIVLIAAVMKSDNRVLRSELDFVKDYFRRSFGEEGALEAIQVLRNVLDQNIPVEEISRQIGRNMDYSSRLQLIHLLYGIRKRMDWFPMRSKRPLNGSRIIWASAQKILSPSGVSMPTTWKLLIRSWKSTPLPLTMR